MKTKPKRRRKTHKREYPGVKIVSPTGKLRLLSCIRASERKRAEYKNPDAGFWADWKPLRKLGTYANERQSSYGICNAYSKPWNPKE